VLSISLTSLLFFYRVRAVFSDSRSVTAFFGLMWIATSGLTVLIPLSLGGGVSPSPSLLYPITYLNFSSHIIQHIGPTNRCINTAVRSFGFAPIVLNAVNDTLVFVAISYKIVSNTAVGNGWRACVSSFFRADGLPILSKALLQGGQLLLCSLHLKFLLCITRCYPSLTSPSQMLWPAASSEPLSWVSSKTIKARMTGSLLDLLVRQTVLAMSLLSNDLPCTSRAICRSTWILRGRRI